MCFSKGSFLFDFVTVTERKTAMMAQKTVFRKKLIKFSVITTVFTGALACAAFGLMGSSAWAVSPNDTKTPFATPALSPSEIKDSYSFGIVPQQAARKLARLWAPLLAHVGKEAGVTLVFRTAQNIPEFEKRLAEGAYDFSYMNPYHYTVFQETPGYKAMVRQRDKRIQGIVVVPADSEITTLAALDGKTLAFPAPAAFAASVLPRAFLKREGITITPKYVSSHDSVYGTVSMALYPAGGGIMRTLNNIEPALRDRLRILWRTPKYTPHAFAAHPDQAPDIVERITQAFVTLHETKDGQALLEAMRFGPLTRAKDNDWDDVRALKIQELEGFGPKEKTVAR